MISLGKRLSINTTQRGSVAIYTLNGKMLESLKVKKGRTQLELPHAAGFYVVRLHVGNTVVSEKILVK